MTFVYFDFRLHVRSWNNCSARASFGLPYKFWSFSSVLYVSRENFNCELTKEHNKYASKCALQRRSRPHIHMCGGVKFLLQPFILYETRVSHLAKRTKLNKHYNHLSKYISFSKSIYCEWVTCFKLPREFVCKDSPWNCSFLLVVKF